MTRIDHIAASFVESIPAQLEPGILYVSIGYRTMSHLCACGCGRRVATPIRPRPQGWTVAYDGINVSISPSVGLAKLPCRSHYFIDRGRVLWMPTEESVHVRERHDRSKRTEPIWRRLFRWRR